MIKSFSILIFILFTLSVYQVKADHVIHGISISEEVTVGELKSLLTSNGFVMVLKFEVRPAGGLSGGCDFAVGQVEFVQGGGDGGFELAVTDLCPGQTRPDARNSGIEFGIAASHGDVVGSISD